MIQTRPTNSKYLKISKGFITDTNGVQLGNMIGGKIIDIEFKIIEAAAGTLEVLNVTLAWQGQTCTLSLPTDTLGRGFMLVLPNIDWHQVVEINAACNEKGYSYIWVTQFGKTVKQYWTMEDPGNKPQWEQNQYGKYDKTKELIYLKGVSQTFAAQIKEHYSTHSID